MVILNLMILKWDKVLAHLVMYWDEEDFDENDDFDFDHILMILK